MTDTTKAVNIRSQTHDVYVGRNRTGKPPSKWGNPFPIGKTISAEDLRAIGRTDLQHLIDPKQRIDRDQSISLYRALLEARLRDGTLTPKDFRKIYGLRLGCFCKPAPCHADLIAEYANWFHDNPHATAGPPHKKTSTPQKLL